MREKRMFSNSVLNSDAFTDMSLSAQALYFHLNLGADDDGFIANPNMIRRMIGASEENLQELLDRRFIIRFDDGILAVKHWRMHNTIRKDMYVPTNYEEDFSKLKIKENGAYTLSVTESEQMPLQVRNESVTSPLQECTTDKIRLDKNRLDKNIYIESSTKSTRFVPPTHEEVSAYAKEKGLTRVDADRFIDFYECKGWMVGKNKMKDWKAAVRNWNRRQDTPVKKVGNMTNRNNDYDELTKKLLMS